MSEPQADTDPSASGGKLVDVILDEASISRSTPEVEHDRAVAIYDLIEENRFQPVGHPSARFILNLSVIEKKLIFAIRTEDGQEVITHVLSLSPLRKIVKDYDLICQSYYEAIRHATPSQIEAIDMGRRGVHNEGSTVLMERLEGKVDVDMQTARRLFTLVYALHWKG
ncbi:UPF0262 family protein [Roseibium marinum]|uniref:UPF0262 protein CLV41_103121 n=1 Tax=Roseibium marinum TaxID=281252 RepID=A0A2S3UWV5_9HYPH|nr:UPF0262 family protein [Roseibium marinum]POF32201.1 uncharacterized protein (UPF0262 family) [Roseibium marinum]